MKRGAPPTEEDLEATAELPAIDFAPASAPAGRESDPAVITDIYVVPAIPVGAPELAENLRELEQQLKRERARMQDVEAQLAATSEREAALQAQLAEAGEQHAGLKARLDEADARYAAMEVQLQSRPEIQPPAVVIHTEAGDLAELRRCSERQLEALVSWEGFRGLSDSLLAEAEARNAQLEAQVATLGDSLRALERKHYAAAPVRDNENQALKSELAALKSDFGSMQAVLSALRDRLQQSEQQVEAEVARSRRLENEVQAGTLLGGSPKNAEQPARDNADKHGATQVVQAAVPRRVLVRLQGGAEVVYPIGRRTTIGRMPDNDIQLDTANVSRHHAVVLANADQCIVEDLNSTNGVLVNGQRVGRHPLYDGDILSVGKAEFRFQQYS